MILNLRDLETIEQPKARRFDDSLLAAPANSFVYHGQQFTALGYRQNEAGFMDAMAGVNPCQNSVAYRKGYLEYLVSPLQR